MSIAERPDAEAYGPDPSSPSPAPSCAAAALARGTLGLARSFRLHRPRGAFCHAGWCQQCLIRLSRGGSALACRLPSGTDAHTGLAGIDPLRPLGMLAERLPPWFYERRLLRPRLLRQAYLDLLRRLSSAPTLAPGPAPRRGSWRETTCQTLVVGGGLAGLAAARTLAGAGRDVLLVEADQLGGTAIVMPTLSGHAAGAVTALRQTRARIETGTLCTGLYEDGRRALCITPSGPLLTRLQELIVATGAYDRLLAFRNNDLPGIVGLRAFERLCAARAVPRSWRIGLFAAPAAAARATEAATGAGIRLAWLAGPEPFGQLSEDAPAPLPPASIRAAEGRGRLRAVLLEPGGRVACDLLVLGFSQPTYELQMQAGLGPALTGEPATLVPRGCPVIPLLVVGEAAGVASPLEAGQEAERAVARWIGEAATFTVSPLRAVAERPRPAALPSPDAFICPCEDVRLRDIERAVAEGFGDVDLVKRRTGAGTGPCQGKLCHAELLRCLERLGAPVALPTVRPLVRPVSLATLAGADHG